MKMRLLFIVFCSFSLNAQFLPNLEIPKSRPTEYESMQTKTIAHTLIDFQLKGPVKAVNETIRALRTNGEDSSSLMRATYLFSAKGKLLNYSEDSTTYMFMRYNQANRIINTYDTTGELLLETIRYIDYGQRSKTLIRFNEQGFRTSEIYTCYGCVSGSHRQDPYYDSIFDYTLNYHWTPDFDSVFLKYKYVKLRSHYQRDQDAVRSFVHELNGRKKQSNEPVSIETARNLYFDTFEEDIKRDLRKRITEYTIWDHAIKNSINVHRRTAYDYNENNELTEIRHYSSGWNYSGNNFQLELTEEIVYLAYDAYGNWTELEVKVKPEEAGGHYTQKAMNFRYKREINYY